MIIKNYVKSVTHILMGNLKEIYHCLSTLFFLSESNHFQHFCLLTLVLTFMYLNNMFELTSYLNEDLAFLLIFTPMSHLHPS